MYLILFAIIGMEINAGAFYWLVFSLAAIWKLTRFLGEFCYIGEDDHA